jgi:hypothetical protein
MRNPLKRSSQPDAPPPVPQDDHRTSFPPALSILPDRMAVSYDVWDAVPLPGYHRLYPLHNPVGPRFYRNIHLIPPSQIRPGARPPSVFSPSFPPISTSDAGPPSASRSTLPTPSSSQTRVADGSKQRSRKTSQGTPDNVDLMDVTDPWGTNWHHTSPYDIGLPATSNSDNYDVRAVSKLIFFSTCIDAHFLTATSQAAPRQHDRCPDWVPEHLQVSPVPIYIRCP